MQAIAYDMLYMFPICMVSVYYALYEGVILLGSSTGSGTESMSKIYVLAAVILALCIVLRHGDRRLRYALTGGIILTGVLMIYVQPRESRALFVSDHQWMLVTAFISVCVYGICRLLTMRGSLRRFLVGTLIVGILAALFWNIPMSKAVFALLVIPIMCGLIEEMEDGWRKNRADSNLSYLVTIAPFILLVSLLVYLAPSQDKPFSWEFVGQIYERASDAAQRAVDLITGGDDFAGEPGFSESSNFKGTVSGSSDREIMKVTFGRNSGSVVYLAGKTFDSFDGREWEKTYNSAGSDRKEDIWQTQEAFDTLGDNQDAYMRRATATIELLDYRTKHVFSPLKSEVTMDGGSNDVEEVGADLLSLRQMGYETSYQVSYYRLNQEFEGFGDVARQLEHDATVGGNLSDVNNIDSDGHSAARVNNIDSDGHSAARVNNIDSDGRSVARVGNIDDQAALDARNEYIRSVYEHYLPDIQGSKTHESNVQLSERTRQYLEEQMADCHSSFDKLTRLEDLLSHMQYDLNPGKLPSSVKSASDYLDYFLFESRRGYCNHYATAFVLMARSMGIPARYVQGYAVVRGDSDVTVVTPGMAHAWPEAYIEGIGWMSFEPTPGKKIRKYWVVEKASEQEALPYQNANAYEMQDKENELDNGMEQTGDEVASGHRDRLLAARILFIALVLIGFVVIVLICDMVISRRRFGRMGPAQQFEVICARNLKLLKILGLTRGTGETLEEFGRRISLELRPDVISFIQNMEKVAYAGAAVERGMCDGALRCQSILLELLHVNKGRKYYLYMVTLGRQGVYTSAINRRGE